MSPESILKPLEQAHWQKYVDALSASQKEKMNEVFVSAGYAGNPQITDELLGLYLCGRKTAGSSLMEDFLSCGERLPQVGDHWIYLDSSGTPRCILKTEKIVVNKFKDVPEEIAVAEGEGDLSLAYWKRVHSELYMPFLKTWGVENLDEAWVLTEFFSIVYR